MSALRWGLYHRERPVVHDETSRARGCFEVRHLRHESHGHRSACKENSRKLL
jgi:hypothetical protein